MKRTRRSATRIGTVLVALAVALVAIGLLSRGSVSPASSTSKAGRAGQSLASAERVASADKAPAARDKGDKKSKDPAPIEPTPEEPPAPPAPPAPEEPPAPPAPAVPPVDPAPAPEAPPIVPEEPPVTPGPEEPLAPPAAPGAVATVSCVSGDMADIITFQPPTAGSVTSYTLLAASEEGGEYSLVATASADARSFTYAVSECAAAFYRIGVTGPGGEGPASGAVSNAQVLITAEVTPSGATLRASNGEVSLALAPGSFATTTTVTVTEVAGSPRGNLIALAGVYEITPSGSLGAPATLSVAYSSPVAHHEVSAALLSAAGLMTYDESAGAWMNGASGITADGTYITGTLSHFSYWTGATIQPHGTSTTAYCSSGGICHDLTTYPGSTVRYSSRDSQICYNCHGNTDAALPPAGADPTSPNIQAELFQVTGQVRPAGASTHPVATGDLYCTACHDPHADPVASPGLLKAWDPVTGGYVQGGAAATPGTEFCWTCHGAIKNRRVDYLVPGYYTASGGDKKTAFNGAHTAVGTATWRFDSESELKRGYTGSTAVQPDGTVLVAGSVALPKTPLPPITASFTPSDPLSRVYDGNPGNYFQWFAKDIGAAGAAEWNPLPGTASFTIDLGSPTAVQAFDCDLYYQESQGAGTYGTDVLEILASDDGTTWQRIALQGEIGTRLADHQTLSSSSPTDPCRYVRFVFSRVFTNPWHSILPAEVTIYATPTQGTYEVWPDIARKATYQGGVVKWASPSPATTSIAVSTRASIDNGSTWTPWASAVNGAAFTQIAPNASLEKARLQVRATLNGTAVQQQLDWLEVSITRGAIVGATPQWSGDSPANQCMRCHTSHGSASPGLVANGSSEACTRCHSAAYGGSYKGKVTFSASRHAAVPCAGCHTAHGKANGTGVTNAYLLKDGRTEVCRDCHPVVMAAYDAKQGVGSEWARHDVYSAEQVKTGSPMACRTCHGTHFSTSGLVNPDPLVIDTPFTATRPDPTSIPTVEVVIYATKDTLLDSTAGQESWNYGSSSQVTVTTSKRALFYFDLSSIPADATIQNAQFVLWGDLAGTYVGGYSLAPVLRDWNEGTGQGQPNSPAINGATWQAWNYGNNWSVPGGDFGAVSVTGSAINSANVTTLVRSLKQGPNYGVALAANGASTSLPFYTRETATVGQRPKLRIVYQTGPATEQVVDDITFCTECHDKTKPMGITGQTLKTVSMAYYMSSSVHGGAKGRGPESSLITGYMPSDTGGGYLKAPYSYGMDALPCTTCHDPHGSRLPYHLKEEVNGREMTPWLAAGWDAGTVSRGDAGFGYFCAACHVFPANHAYYETAVTGCFGGCHSH